MHDQSFFFQAFVYLLAAVLMVPVAKRLGLGSVLGYLAAGVIIGLTVLGFIGADGQDVMEFAEFGVVIMLFLVGLEPSVRLLVRDDGDDRCRRATEHRVAREDRTGIRLAGRKRRLRSDVGSASHNPQER